MIVTIIDYAKCEFYLIYCIDSLFIFYFRHILLYILDLYGYVFLLALILEEIHFIVIGVNADMNFSFQMVFHKLIASNFL